MSDPASKTEALALELADKTSREEAAFKASFAPLARSHWDEIKHGAAAEERRRALRAGMAAAAAQAAAGEAAREAESCALLVELAAGETRAWKEAAAEKVAENAVARSKGETDALQDAQVRRIRATRKGAKAATRVTRATERSEAALQRQEDAEREVDCAVRNCLNFQRAVIAKHQRLRTALAEFGGQKEMGAAAVEGAEEEEEGRQLQRLDEDTGGDESVLAALRAEISALRIEEEGDRQKLALMETQSQANGKNLDETVAEFVNAAGVLAGAIDKADTVDDRKTSNRRDACVGCNIPK